MKSGISQLAAVFALSSVSVSAANLYVNVNSTSPTPPYSNWATAATTIQDAVDSAVVGDEIIVTNGVYQTGGRAVVGTTTNRVTVNKPIKVQSVNGAAVTLVRGFQVPGTTNDDGAVRCVYLASGATLIGFTLTNGATQRSDDGWGESGGGVLCESASAIVSNCTITANSAGIGGGAAGGTLNNCTLNGNSGRNLGGGALGSTLNNCTITANSAFLGGGIYGGTLNNCTLTANRAAEGGGAQGGTLNNCTLTANVAGSYGGGADYCTLNNCIVYYNSAQIEANHFRSSLSYSCTTPLPTNGIGNLTNAPLFVDYAAENLRLQPNSPCINAGSNASAPAGPDLDGNLRIGGGTVDVGAYEFQSPQSLISYAWLQQYSLSTDGSSDHTDTDGDGMNNWREWRAGTNPTNALSTLRLLSTAPSAPGPIVSWKSVAGLNYFLERSTHLEAQPPFLPLATNIVGQPGTTTFTDANAVGIGPFFYRVGVQE